MYTWENDPQVWRVSNTVAPCSYHSLEKFVEEQRFDLFQSQQLRLIVEQKDNQRAVGCVDLFEIDPLNSRAGVGILIHDHHDRQRGYAKDALETLEDYAKRHLRMHQLWCNVGAENEASLRLFESIGYQRVGVKLDWQWTPEGFTDEVTYQKIL